MTVVEGILEVVLDLAVAHSMVAAEDTHRDFHHTADRGMPWYRKPICLSSKRTNVLPVNLPRSYIHAGESVSGMKGKKGLR